MSDPFQNDEECLQVLQQLSTLGLSSCSREAVERCKKVCQADIDSQIDFGVQDILGLSALISEFPDEAVKIFSCVEYLISVAEFDVAPDPEVFLVAAQAHSAF